jgi:hypothetical protein
MSDYDCANCRRAVAVSDDGTVTRSCECPSNTPVIAERASVLCGSGVAESKTLATRATSAIRRLLGL